MSTARPASPSAPRAADAPASGDARVRWRRDMDDTATASHTQAAWGVLMFIVADTLLLSAFSALADVPATAALAFALVGTGIFALYRLGLALGWHRRWRGLFLSMVITSLVALLLLGMALFVPQVGLLMLITLLPTLSMTSLVMPLRFMVPMCVLLGACSAVPMLLHGRALSLPMATPAEAALSALWFTILLGRGALLSIRGTAMRTALARKSTALADALQKLEQLATHDELTGLLNRRAAMEVLASESQRAARHGHSFSVALFDLDHFKQINDTLGHAAGDDVLKRFAACMQGAVRASDRLARHGGEEFLLVMPEQPQLQGAAQVADRLRAAVQQQPWSELAPDLRVTVSIGVATSQPGESIEQLLARADQALYRAKHAGRNCVHTG